MGSSSSSEQPQQTQTEEQPAQRGPQVTFSPFASQQAGATKSYGAAESRYGSGVDERNEANDQSPSSRAHSRSAGQQQRPTQRRHARRPRQLRDSSLTSTDGVSFESDPDLQNLVAKIKSTQITSPELVQPNTDLEKELSRRISETLSFYEAANRPLIAESSELAQKIVSTPSPKPIHLASGGSDSAICPSDHLALVDCLSSKAPQDCTSLMANFSACSVAFHLDQQAKRSATPRQL